MRNRFKEEVWRRRCEGKGWRKWRWGSTMRRGTKKKKKKKGGGEKEMKKLNELVRVRCIDKEEMGTKLDMNL